MTHKKDQDDYIVVLLVNRWLKNSWSLITMYLDGDQKICGYSSNKKDHEFKNFSLFSLPLNLNFTTFWKLNKQEKTTHHDYK